MLSSFKAEVKKLRLGSCDDFVCFFKRWLVLSTYFNDSPEIGCHFFEGTLKFQFRLGEFVADKTHRKVLRDKRRPNF